MVLTTLAISACGGGGGESGSASMIVTSQPQTPSTETESDSEASTQPPEQTTPSSDPEVVPQPGPCVDTPPLNNGFGWNGVDTCELSVEATPEPLSNSQWSNRTWNCVSNIPEITARWQLQINADRTFFDLSRPISDPQYVGSWIDNGGAGFTTNWADGRTFDYMSIGSGFIDNGGSRCHEDFFPLRPGDIEPEEPEDRLPVLAEGDWEYPVFFCQAWENPDDVWAWALSPDGHVRNENRIIAGSYLFQSQTLQLFITNHEGEQSQWSAVDFESLTTSWGGCAHVAGPTLRTADLSPSNTDYCLACHSTL